VWQLQEEGFTGYATGANGMLLTPSHMGGGVSVFFSLGNNRFQQRQLASSSGLSWTPIF